MPGNASGPPPAGHGTGLMNFRNFAIWARHFAFADGAVQVFQTSAAPSASNLFQPVPDRRRHRQRHRGDDHRQYGAGQAAKTGAQFQTVLPPERSDVVASRRPNVEHHGQRAGSSPFWSILLSSWLPFLVIIGVWFFFIRQMQGGGRGGAMGFGKSNAPSC